MGTEELTQIVETIKTLNLNLDSQSAVEIVQTLEPIIWFYLIRDMVVNVLGLIAFVVAIWIISKAILKFVKKSKE